jgi:hypothetical protein
LVLVGIGIGIGIDVIGIDIGIDVIGIDPLSQKSNYEILKTDYRFEFLDPENLCSNFIKTCYFLKRAYS